MLHQPHQFPYPDHTLDILMVLTPNSKYIKDRHQNCGNSLAFSTSWTWDFQKKQRL